MAGIASSCKKDLCCIFAWAAAARFPGHTNFMAQHILHNSESELR